MDKIEPNQRTLIHRKFLNAVTVSGHPHEKRDRSKGAVEEMYIAAGSDMTEFELAKDDSCMMNCCGTTDLER